MTYVEQIQGNRGIVGEIRDLLANAVIPNLFRLIAQNNHAPTIDTAQLDETSKHDLGVSREYHDYSAVAGFSGSNGRRLHGIADNAGWNIYR